MWHTPELSSGTGDAYARGASRDPVIKATIQEKKSSTKHINKEKKLQMTTENETQMKQTKKKRTFDPVF